MSVDGRLSSLIAALGRVPVARVTPEARLGDLGVSSSIVIGILQSRLRDLFAGPPLPLARTTTIAEIERALAGAANVTATSRPAQAPTPTGTVVREARHGGGVAMGAAIGIGLDLEDIASMPEMGDPFYADHFSSAELAAAERAADPRAHLCGVWCAKEAAIKAVPELRQLALTEIEVTTDVSGRPSIGVSNPARATLLPRLELSITHTSTSAAAVVLATSRR